MPEAATTLGMVILRGAEQLRSANIPDPRQHAHRIWSDLAGTALADVVLGGDREVGLDAAGRFELAVARRVRGEPLAHVTGITGFRRLVLAVDSRVLIPRPETEGLVDLILERVSSGRIADVGTGSGCLALSLAQEGGFSQVVGVDCSADGLAVARLNQRVNGLPVDLVCGDLCRPLRPRAFDALISNPPYLTEAEYRDLDPSVGDWEPELALVGGADGMSAMRRLLDEGRDVLSAGGWLALELDCTRAVATAAHANDLGWQDVSVHMDLFARERYLLARRSNTR